MSIEWFWTRRHYETWLAKYVSADCEYIIYVFLYHSQITDVGVDILINKNLPHLEILNLSNQFTNEGNNQITN